MEQLSTTMTGAENGGRKRFINDADPRIFRQAERMNTPQEESSSSSSSRPPQPATIQGAILLKTEEDDTMDHEEMEDGSSQAGIEDNDRMLMSLTPDRTVQKRINQTWHDIERERKNRDWKDDVESVRSIQEGRKTQRRHGSILTANSAWNG